MYRVGYLLYLAIILFLSIVLFWLIGLFYVFERFLARGGGPSLWPKATFPLLELDEGERSDPNF